MAKYEKSSPEPLDFNQTCRKAFLSEGDSSLFVWGFGFVFFTNKKQSNLGKKMFLSLLINVMFNHSSAQMYLLIGTVSRVSDVAYGHLVYL